MKCRPVKETPTSRLKDDIPLLQALAHHHCAQQILRALSTQKCVSVQNASTHHTCSGPPNTKHKPTCPKVANTKTPTTSKCYQEETSNKRNSSPRPCTSRCPPCPLSTLKVYTRPPLPMTHAICHNITQKVGLPPKVRGRDSSGGFLLVPSFTFLR